MHLVHSSKGRARRLGGGGQLAHRMLQSPHRTSRPHTCLRQRDQGRMRRLQISAVHDVPADTPGVRQRSQRSNQGRRTALPGTIGRRRSVSSLGNLHGRQLGHT